MRIGSLFSGAAGLDMAVQAVFGGEVAWHSEIDKAASKVLAYRFPGVPNLGDITEINWANWKPMLEVDVLCGGFPCQDVSAAGKRAGIKDGTRSGLWAVFADAIDALRPQWVVIENVRGLLSATAHRTVESDDAAMGDGGARPVLRAIGAVVGDLADLGYVGGYTVVSAAAVGAPHRRERVFIVAHSGGAAVRKPAGSSFAEETWQGSGDRSGDSRGKRTVTDGRQACGCGCRRIDHDWFANPDRFDDGGCRRCKCEEFWPASHSARYGWHEGRPEPAGIIRGFDAAVSGDEPGVALLPTPRSQDANGYQQRPDADIGNNGRTVSLADRVTRLPGVSGDEPGVALLPTPNADVARGVRSPDGIAKHIAKGDKQFSLEDAVALLPTPSTHDKTGVRSPESIARMDKAFANLNDTAVNELAGVALHFPLCGTCGHEQRLHCDGIGRCTKPCECLGWSDGEFDVALLPTPCVVDRLATGEMTLDEWDECRRSQKERGVGSFGPRGDSLGAAILRVEEGSERPDYSTTKARRAADDGVALLPTPTTQDGANNGDPSQFQRNTLPLNAEVTLLPTPNAQDGNGGKAPRGGRDTHNTGTKRQVPLTDLPDLLCTLSASDGAGGKTSRSGGRIDEPLLGGQAREMATAWGKYAPAIQRWESLTRPAPAPTEPNKNGNPRLSAAFSEWLMGWPAGWVTDPAIGISRNDQLRIVGNGVCPQQAAAALRYLLAITNQHEGGTPHGHH